MESSQWFTSEKYASEITTLFIYEACLNLVFCSSLDAHTAICVFPLLLFQTLQQLFHENNILTALSIVE